MTRSRHWSASSPHRFGISGPKQPVDEVTNCFALSETSLIIITVTTRHHGEFSRGSLLKTASLDESERRNQGFIVFTICFQASNIRRLAADHAALHRDQLPPYYLLPPDDGHLTAADDLSQLNVLITGPPGTPYAEGLWRLHLKMPKDYPNSPPKATFRTKIWHPNVDESTGAVCVDTLKKDWESNLTLRDVLIVSFPISPFSLNPGLPGLLWMSALTQGFSHL